jgi:hypothetical protein
VVPPDDSGAESSAYKPYTNTRRPGGSPDYEPVYRVLVHRTHEARWSELAARIGLEQAQRFYDHVATTPGTPAEGISVSVLKGSAGKPHEPGFSRTLHWRIPGNAARLDYQYNAEYRGGSRGDAHGVVRIVAITYTSH